MSSNELYLKTLNLHLLDELTLKYVYHFKVTKIYPKRLYLFVERYEINPCFRYIEFCVKIYIHSERDNKHLEQTNTNKFRAWLRL